jgi:nucleotidyltransferase substrate binding protein (TIGR01987 family)
MTSGKLDFTSLRNALARLAEGYQRYQSDISDIQIRDGLIQRYEFTYEISHKMLKRYLEMTAANPEAFDALPFADLIRTGNEQSLLKSDWSAWKIFREMRALANNALEDKAALEIVRIIPLFIEEIQFFICQLNNHAVTQQSH